MVTFQISVPSRVGLHAHPAAEFVKTANRFTNTAVRLRRAGSNGSWMNAKSILSVLSLGVEYNEQIELQFEGDEEQAAAEALRALIAGNFGGRG
jgi:phosphocarrier protein